MEINRRKLESVYYLIAQDITFANDAIGAAAGTGRAATSVWAADDEVIFKGKLKHVLAFGLMAFDVASVAVNELFSLVPERQFTLVKNLADVDVIPVVDIDPTAGEGIVEADDITFLSNLTNGLRGNWMTAQNVIVSEKADPTNKAYYIASLLETLAYAMQFQNAGSAPIYTLYDFALMNTGAGKNYGVQWVDLDGSNGPVEIERAHVTLGSLILNAPTA